MRSLGERLPRRGATKYAFCYNETMLTLKNVNTDIEKEWRFVCDMPADENGFINSWHGLTKDDYINKAMPEMIQYQRGENLPEGYVPETVLFLWDDDLIVGQFRIRHFLNDALRVGVGHLAYFIAKEFRKMGYGAEGLRLALEYASKIVPEDEYYLRVNRDNPASLKVMLKNGGRIVDEDTNKYYVRIKKQGELER